MELLSSDMRKVAFCSGLPATLEANRSTSSKPTAPRLNSSVFR
jgi:hypothetical protein